MYHYRRDMLLTTILLYNPMAKYKLNEVQWTPFSKGLREVVSIKNADLSNMAIRSLHRIMLNQS